MSEMDKIAITCTGKDLDNPLDQRFGRCAYFLITNENGSDVHLVENKAATQGSGAGVQAAQLVIDNQVSVVLTGNVGPKAMALLRSANIEIYMGTSGTARAALEDFKAGKLNRISEAGPSKGGFGRFR